MDNMSCHARSMSVAELLEIENLNIPDYQRPYKWDTQNIDDLLNDISEAIKLHNTYEDFKYRIGSIILHENHLKDQYGNAQKDLDGKDIITLDIVDGQQRIISLALIWKCLKNSFNCAIFKKGFESRITQGNIHNNYAHIKKWSDGRFANDDDEKWSFLNHFSDVLEVIVITVNDVSEAFQLFDSQNTRGRKLDPHDLLKAYHLREMKGYPYEMRHAVTKWESKKPEDIRILFNTYLFRIWNWCNGNKTISFTEKEISTFKGISQSSNYYYARRASSARPFFQITEPFISGSDFFEMVDHYLVLLDDIKKEIEENPSFGDINDVLNCSEDVGLSGFNGNAGFSYAKDLFYCALLCYYDKFHNFDPLVVKDLFKWAFMLRVDMEHLGLDSINNYAIGDSNNKYTNHISMFSKINRARLHTEISCLTIETEITKTFEKKKDGSKDKREVLHNTIQKIAGNEVASNA